MLRAALLSALLPGGVRWGARLRRYLDAPAEDARGQGEGSRASESRGAAAGGPEGAGEGEGPLVLELEDGQRLRRAPDSYFRSASLVK